MFDRVLVAGAGGAGASAGVPAPGAAEMLVEVGAWRESLQRLAHEVAGGADGGERVDPASVAADALVLIGRLEALRNAAAAAQAALAVRVDRCRRQEEARSGVAARRRGAGAAAEVALARQVGVSAGSRLLGLGKVLCGEMPHTFTRLAAGDLSEWRASLLARETACLEVEDRVAVDEQLCADPGTLAGLGDRALAARAKRAGYRRDAESVVKRAEVAEGDRRVWLRPAPDQMAYLTALLPLTQAVACYASLKHAADTARATGDPGACDHRPDHTGTGTGAADIGTGTGRASGHAAACGCGPAGTGAARTDHQRAARSHGQVMADTLVTRLTGQADPAAVPVRVNLLMTDTTLFTGDTEPGIVPGHGPVPAGWAREQIGKAGAPAWIRRLYVAPRTGDLVAMDTRTRAVPSGLAEFIALRDQGGCRMPWCDAPARHLDHIIPVADDGRTTEANLQGLCETHNYAKQAPGWHQHPRPTIIDGINELTQIRATPVTGSSTTRTTTTEATATSAGADTFTGRPAAGRDDVIRRVSRSGRHETSIRTPAGHRYATRAPQPPRRTPTDRGTPQGPAP